MMKTLASFFLILFISTQVFAASADDFSSLYEKYKNNCLVESQDPLVGAWTYSDIFVASKGVLYSFPIDENSYAGFLQTESGVISLGSAPREYRKDGAIGNSSDVLTSVEFGGVDYGYFWKFWETSGHDGVCFSYGGAGHAQVNFFEVQRTPCSAIRH